MATKKRAVAKKKTKAITKPTPRRTVRRAVKTKRTVTKKEAVAAATRPRYSLTRPLYLRKAGHNPIIAPDESQPWRTRATFNPAAVYLDGMVHLVYRAIGDSDQSVLGYARTRDGLHLDLEYPGVIYPLEAVERSNPVAPSKSGKPIVYASGGGTGGGCEDPRLTSLGDNVYLIYTAFDGWSSLRLALTWIRRDDFLNGRWWCWRSPVFISPPGEINKNWVMFPEKIHGKFAILHSIFKGIEIEYFDDPATRFNGHSFITNSPRWGSSEPGRWDSQVRGAGPPPIKTEEGWLLLYHAIDHRDPGRYKLGVMLLDLNDPKKILYRCQAPVLSPDAEYENNGHKSGIVYSCGAVVVDDTLFVYYGGADRVVCVASAPFKRFLNQLMTTGKPTFARVRRITK